jgi:hypothetical protein
MKIHTPKYLILIFVTYIIVACSPKPHGIKSLNIPVPIYPDYIDVTIPVNIAPLNFLLRNEADIVEVKLKGENDSLTVYGNPKVRFPEKAWKRLLKAETGNKISVQVTARINEIWVTYPIFYWKVVSDKIDNFLSYRLIEPGYEVWNGLQICERNIENFDERVIADNNQLDRSCMNCHIYGNQNGNLSMFHLRGKNGGTILNRNGKIRKLTLKKEGMISPAVYGGFHPTGNFAVFSTNIIIPEFHAKGNIRMEVYDPKSDVVVIDFDNNRILQTPLLSDSLALETFPVFSADGKYIYFCSAPLLSLPDNIKNLKYSICRITFDADKKAFGTTVDTLWNARLTHKSVCHLKVSPDGKYILYTVADYGTFPIWHREADLQLMNLQTREVDNMPKVNSDRSDTYHSWSSNSRWFVFASKRGDGQYGKPYFAYVNKSGKVDKPFVLPQKNPSHYDETLKSYNIPELSKSKLPFSAADIENTYKNIKAEKFE